MKPEITDHALLRWLERVDGVDVELLRNDVAERVAEAYATRAYAVPFAGVWLVFRDGKLITVSPAKPKPKNHAKHDRSFVNGTDRRDGPLHWKGLARKRAR